MGSIPRPRHNQVNDSAYRASRNDHAPLNHRWAKPRVVAPFQIEQFTSPSTTFNRFDDPVLRVEVYCGQQPRFFVAVESASLEQLGVRTYFRPVYIPAMPQL